MMKRLAEFATQGLPQAIIATTGFSLLALMVPLLGVFGVLSNAIVALVALKVGTRQAVWVAVLSAAGLALLMLGNKQLLLIGFLSSLLQWLPLIGLAFILVRTASWQWVMQVVLGVGIVCVVLLYLINPEIDQFWQQLLDKLVQSLAQEKLELGVQQQEAIAALTPLISGLLLAALVFSTLLALMLARAMQAAVVNPGGFRNEFEALKVGQWPALMAIAFIALSTLVQASWAYALLALAVTIFFIQGLAVAHGLVTRLGWPSSSLIGLYVLLVFFLPPVVMLLTGIGIVDEFANFRQRLGSAAD